MLIHEDAEYCNALVARLNRLYKIDGRDNPEHPWHGTYVGLHQKFTGISSPGDQDLHAA